jgi:hypothetical protein
VSGRPAVLTAHLPPAPAFFPALCRQVERAGGAAGGAPAHAQRAQHAWRRRRRARGRAGRRGLLQPGALDSGGQPEGERAVWAAVRTAAVRCGAQGLRAGRWAAADGCLLLEVAVWGTCARRMPGWGFSPPCLSMQSAPPALSKYAPTDCCSQLLRVFMPGATTKTTLLPPLNAPPRLPLSHQMTLRCCPRAMRRSSVSEASTCQASSNFWLLSCRYTDNR